MTRTSLALVGLGLVALLAASFAAGAALRDDGRPSQPGTSARALTTSPSSPRIDPLTTPPRLPELRRSASTSAPSAAVAPPAPSREPSPGASAPPPPPPPQPVLPPDPVPR